MMNGACASALNDLARKVTEDFARRGYFPSAVVRVFDRDGTLFTFAVGDVREETRYDVASLTKLTTSTQILQMIERGTLCLSDEILSFFPNAAADATLARALGGVTIERLLTHTSGLKPWHPMYAEAGDFWQRLSRALSGTTPETGMVYSDLNFMILGELVSSLCGMPLAGCLRANLTDPLGIPPKDMRFGPLPQAACAGGAPWRVAPSGYGNPHETDMIAEEGCSFDGFRAPDALIVGSVHDGNAHYFGGGVCGHAGVFARASAYETLMRLYLNAPDGSLLADATRDRGMGRGLGFQCGEMYPLGCGHTGFTGTACYISRSLNIGAIAFANRLFYKEENPRATNEFRRALFRQCAIAAGAPF